MRPNRWWLLLGISLSVVAACAPEGGGEDDSAGKTVFPKDRKRRILYYDAASQETWGYLDQGRKIPYMKLIADITDHQSFLDVRTNMTFGTQVDTYATLNGNSYRAGAWEGLYGRLVFREGMRASAAYYHQEAADGIYLFNYANEPAQELSREEFISALSELGEAETLAGKNKVYGIHSTAHTGGPIIQGSESALLPVVLDRVETKLPLLMGPDADDENARFLISLWTAESREHTQIWVRLNHTLLSAPVREEPWYHVDVPSGIMRSGANELGIISDVPAGGPFPGIVAPPGVRRKDWLGWKRNEGTLVDEFAEGRLVRDSGAEERKEPEKRRPVIVHQIFVTVEYPDR